MKQFPKIQINNEEDINSRTVGGIQDNIVDALNPLLALPLSSSNLIENQVLASGSNSINHGLGRNLRGWIVTRKNANEGLYDTQATNPLPAFTLLLTSTGTVTIDLICF